MFGTIFFLSFAAFYLIFFFSTTYIPKSQMYSSNCENGMCMCDMLEHELHLIFTCLYILSAFPFFFLLFWLEQIQIYVKHVFCNMYGDYVVTFIAYSNFNTMLNSHLVDLLYYS